MIIEDLAAMADGQLDARDYSQDTRLAMRLLRKARRGEGADVIGTDVLPGVDEELLRASVRYVLQVDPRATREAIAEALEPSLGPKGKEIAMTEGERLVEEGRRQGIVRGKVEGRAQGRVEGRAQGRVEGRAEGLTEGAAKVAANILLRLFESRGMRLTRSQRARIKETRDPDLLVRWFEEALAGRSVEEILHSRSRN